MTNLTTEFFSGVDNSEDCFSAGNPFISTSSSHMAFEAGRMASFCWCKEEIKAAYQSRGFSIRVELNSSEKKIIKIDYDNEVVAVA